ncbi:MAG: hypothetical protein KF753_07525 [Caldilineaceae bacterium]|nr:hypothetical protein [Caldilineaceae bacterium]
MFTITEARLDTGVGPITYWLHPGQSASSVLLLSFSSTRQASFHEEPYDIPARLFAEAGHAVASFDLPSHGEQVNDFGQGIEGFCAAFCAGADPFARFIQQAKAVIDACLAQGVGQGGIYACGVSRAGYCALRLAAADERVRGVAGLAPVVDWRALREFAGVRQRPDVAALALENWSEALVGRAIFLAIGNRDQRVSSAACVHLGLRLFEAEEAGGVDKSALQLHIVDAEGHALGNEWRRAGAEFLLAQASNNQLGLQI